jgi:hypothetical protein
MNKIMNTRMGNQQLCLNNEQKQVLISGRLGDGHLSSSPNERLGAYYTTNCKYKEYLEFKKNLLGELCNTTNINSIEHNGYSGTKIYTLRTRGDTLISYVRDSTLENILNELDELGLAMWIYDDGSLHKDKLFYNINTQAFPKDIQEELFIPLFNRFNIFPKLTIERKKDGREFWYLRVSKYEGAFEITKILDKYPLECYAYKRWSSETIQRWSKLQEELKSTDIDRRTLAAMLKKVSI